MTVFKGCHEKIIEIQAIQAFFKAIADNIPREELQTECGQGAERQTKLAQGTVKVSSTTPPFSVSETKQLIWNCFPPASMVGILATYYGGNTTANCSKTPDILPTSSPMTWCHLFPVAPHAR